MAGCTKKKTFNKFCGRSVLSTLIKETLSLNHKSLSCPELTFQGGTERDKQARQGASSIRYIHLH